MLFGWLAHNYTSNYRKLIMLDRLKAAAEAFRKGAVEEIKEKEEEPKAPEKETPRVEVLGIVHDPKRGVKISLDWNQEFVDYLRENGVLGEDDEVVVQKWITMLFRDILEEESTSEEIPSEEIPSL